MQSLVLKEWGSKKPSYAYGHGLQKPHDEGSGDSEALYSTHLNSDKLLSRKGPDMYMADFMHIRSDLAYGRAKDHPSELSIETRKLSEWSKVSSRGCENVDLVFTDERR